MILHVVERWLDVSAGFVAAHVARSRHRGAVVATKGWVHPEAFPFRPRHSVASLDRLVPHGRGAGLGVLAWARVHQAALLHVHFGYPAHAALPAARRGFPLVLSLHGEDATALARRFPHHYEPVVPLVRAVIVPSPYFADVVCRLGFARDLVHVIPAGVDLDYFTPAAVRSPQPAEQPTVVHVGRLVAKKGLDVLLEAWPAIRAAVPEATLHVLGDGPMSRLLPTNDPSVVHHLPDPARRREQVRELLERATVVTTPSRTAADGDAESLLLVNLEAMAMRRPVVTTRHGGIPTYVEDERNGLLVPEGDPNLLAAAVTRVLRDDALAGRLSEAARQTAEAFDVRRCTAAVDALYDELAK